jgi:hypothetical protein
MSLQATSKRRIASALGSLVVASALVIGTPVVANAAIHSGMRGCGAQYGYLTGTTSGATQLSPPGSQLYYQWSTGGTRSRVAAYTSGAPKPSGGDWWVYGQYSATGSPYCSPAG